MKVYNIHDANSRLSRLVEQAERGEEVIIVRAGKPVAKLVPCGQGPEEPRRGGQWKGRVRIAEDPDTHPGEFAEAPGPVWQ
jgi:prevent-host-death family protein